MAVYKKFEKYIKIKRYSDGSIEIVKPEVYTKGKLISTEEYPSLIQCENNYPGCQDDGILYYMEGKWTGNYVLNINDYSIEGTLHGEGVLKKINLKETYGDIYKFEVQNFVNYLVLPKLGDNLTDVKFQRIMAKEIKGLECLNTSKITSMYQMFSGSEGLITLDLSNFDTSNVTNMQYMFSGCSGLTELNLSSFDTSKVTTMQYMFQRCGSENLDLTNFNTSNVKNMAYMFYESNIKNLDLSSFDTSNVKNMHYMFENSTIQNIKMNNFIFSNPDMLNQLFKNCGKLKSIELNTKYQTKYKTSLYETFAFCYNIKSIDISGIQVTNSIFHAFIECHELESIIFSDDCVADVGAMAFFGCNKLKYIKCTQEFKDWCITNQDYINLPTSMREGGSGTWEII